MIQVWTCLTTAFTLIQSNLPPTNESLQLFSDLRPPCVLDPSSFQPLASLRFRLDRTELIDRLHAAIETMRELQLYIDCAPDIDSYDEQASVMLYFGEMELVNSLHVLDPSCRAILCCHHSL